MVNLLTDIGEEFVAENNLDGTNITVGLYKDATDQLGDGSTLSDITTEPTGGSYARQSTATTSAQISGDFGIDTDNGITFDTSDSSQTVDAAFIVVNFQSDTVAGDGSATDHLIAAGDLSQSRDLSSVSTVEIPAGDLDITID
jgi:hypothetical protein